jgi:hypothetical protein
VEHKSNHDQQHSSTTVGIILALVVQFGSIIWFAATLNSRVEKVEAAQATLQQRYEKEVIPRADLAERLDRIEQSLDRIIDRLMKEAK